MKNLIKDPLFIGGMLAIIGCIIAFSFGGWNGYWSNLMDSKTTLVGFVIAQIGIIIMVVSRFWWFGQKSE